MNSDATPDPIDPHRPTMGPLPVYAGSPDPVSPTLHSQNACVCSLLMMTKYSTALSHQLDINDRSILGNERYSPHS
jgi:hypothetical protein